MKKDKIIMLVGLMGCGKSSVGRSLAAKLKLPFVDGDSEIEKAAGSSVVDIYERFGEDEFRRAEEKIMRRLLMGDPCVLASGGGAFLSSATRELSKEKAVTIWLKADLDLLCSRTTGRTHRPQLDALSPREELERLIRENYPVYAEADVMIDTFDEHVSLTVKRVIAEIEKMEKQ